MLDVTARNDQTRKHYASVVFQGVTLSINARSFIHNVSCELSSSGKTVVMGANGAGKSLFLRLIAGLFKPDSGKIDICGTEKQGSQEICISMVFQNPVLLRRSAYENIAFVLKQKGMSGRNMTQIAENALHLAQIENHADKAARSLSGGQQQRLALARALVVEPDILLLDEATANLDPASTFIVEKMVDDVSKTGTKIVFVTHDVRQAKRIGDDILFIHDGRILAHKPIKDFFRDPGSNEAQAYLDGRVPDQNLQE